ncbi:MAG: hypothetical protein ACK55Z_21650 [bacterium]
MGVRRRDSSTTSMAGWGSVSLWRTDARGRTRGGQVHREGR